MKKLILLLIVLISISAKEIDFQNCFKRQYKAKSEIVLTDGVRADLIYNGYIIEVDFSKKWYESVGQCLYYSILTNLKPGILLIIDSDNDKFLIRLLILSKKYDIKVWTIDKNFNIIERN